MKIMIPIDGSPASLDAVHETLRLVRDGLRASIVLANVQAPATLYEMVVAHDAQVIEQVSEAAASHALEAARSLLRAAGIGFDTETATGDPGHTLVDIAERIGCDLIVIVARGAGALSGALLGSVSNAVLHGASVPVMVVKPADAG